MNVIFPTNFRIVYYLSSYLFIFIIYLLYLYNIYIIYIIFINIISIVYLKK